MKKPNTNELLVALREHGKAKPRRPLGEGWYTMDELAELEGVLRDTMRYRIRKSREQGLKLESKIGTALSPDGQARRTWYYRLEPKP